MVDHVANVKGFTSATHGFAGLPFLARQLTATSGRGDIGKATVALQSG